MSTKQSVLLCNIVIAALCIASIVAYFIMPFFRVDISYTLTAATLEELLPDTSSNTEEGSTGLLDGLDFSTLLDEDIKLEVSIELKTKQIMSAMNSNSTQLVEDILYDNVHKIVDQLDPYINDIVKKVVKTVVKDVFKSELKEQIKENLSANMTTEDVQKELDDLGLTDTYIDEKTDQLIETIYKEGSTVDDAVTETVNIVKESLEQMKEANSETYGNAELTPEAEEELKELLADKFAILEKEDGTIDPEAFTNDFLLGLLQGEGIDPDILNGMGGTGAKTVSPIAAKSDLNAEQSDAKTELKQELTKTLMNLLGGATDIIATALKYVGFFVWFTIIVWSIPVIMILVKCVSYNNAINLSVPIWLGAIPFIVLYIVPTIALSSVLASVPMLASLEVTFATAAVVSFISTLVLAAMSLLFYRKARKELSF